MSWPTRPRTGATPQTSGMPAPDTRSPLSRATQPIGAGATRDEARYAVPGQLRYQAWQREHEASGQEARRAGIERFRAAEEADEARARRGEQSRYAPVGHTPYAAPAGAPAQPAPAPVPGPAPAQSSAALSGLQMGDPSRTREYADRQYRADHPAALFAPPQPLPVEPAEMGSPIAPPGGIPEPAMLEALRRMMSRGGEY